MSNLGWYQVMTTTAKKVGGPKNLLGLVLGTGIALGVVGTKLYEVATKKIKSNAFKVQEITIYVVKKDGVSNDGLCLEKGDKFKVLEADKDAILIEKIGDVNNPYFVSYELLKDISDYRKGE